MPLGSLSVRLSGVNNDSNDIDGGTGCNFIFFFSDKIQLHRPIYPLYCPSIHYHLRICNVYIRVSSIGPYRNKRIYGGTTRNECKVGATIMNMTDTEYGGQNTFATMG